jgi:Zn ribbon nucleic-acid-binding protein
MIDEWNEELRCPQCNNRGLASLSQPEDAEKPTVECVSDGFKAVQTEYGPDFHCGACDIPVLP